MISKSAEQDLRAVPCLATDTERPALADILAEKTKVPRRYLTRVLQDLAATGLVSSRSGPGSGYVLAHAVGDVTILDVINTVAPLVRINSCPLGLKAHTSLCPLHSELDKAIAATGAAFAAVTIRQFLESTNPIVPLREVSP